jgi:PAS domain S-box-containing protein
MNSHRAARAWSPYIVLVGSLLVTAAAASQVAVMARGQDELRFQNSVGAIYSDVQARMETYLALLRGAAGLFTAADEVSRAEFRSYVSRLRLREYYAGVLGVGFSAQVGPQERGALEARARREGLADFKLHPPGERAEYHAIIYLEPLDERNRAALGFDMFSEPTRREAMERARATGRRAASGKVTLVQEIDERKQAGFLIYLPVYRGGQVPATEAERLALFKGFAYAPFRVDDLLEGILGGRELDVDFEVYDGAEMRPESLLHRSGGGAPRRPLLTTVRTMDVAGRTWGLRFTTRPQFERASSRQLALFTFVGGTVISLLLFAVTRAQSRAHAAAEAAAEELRASQAALAESEERYRTITETASDAIITIDEASRILFVNRAAEKIFGHPAGELAGRPLTLLMPDYLRHAHEAGLRRYVETGRRHINWEGIEVPGLHRDGREVPLEVSFGEFVKDGRHYFTGVVRDISERKQAEEVLRESEARLRAMADAIPQLAWMAEPDGHIFWYNRRWYDFTGTTPEQMEGWGWQTVHDPAILPRVLAGWKASIATGEPFEMEFPLRGADGVFRWFLTRVEPLRDAAGRVVRWFGTNTDIDELRRAREELSATRDELELRVAERTRELAAANAELERSNRELQDFAYVASHDLQEPLRKIQAFSDLLVSQYGAGLGEEGRDFLARMQKASRRMHVLINDLLAFSRVTTKAQPFVPVDLSEVAREVLEDLEARVRQSGGRVEVGELPTVEADPLQMRQLLQNLIGNALKFHRAGEPPAVEVRGETSDNNHCRLTVADNGIGFDEKYLDRIFTPFQRLHGRGEYEGTGMGLAVCRKIVERHGGTITARSAPGAGTTFIVELPLRHHADEVKGVSE